MHSDDFLNGRFRAGSLFRLKEWTALDGHEKRWLRELADSEEMYGLFVPNRTAPHLTAKIAYLDTALLFYHFQQHKQLPNSFLNRSGNELSRAMARLVLDQILEIEWKGKFLSGNDAVPAIQSHRSIYGKTAITYLSTLSMQAASYAFLLKRKDIRSLSQWLYTCHTLPADGFSNLSLTTEKDVYHYVVSGAGHQLDTLSTHWNFSPPQENFRWFSWSRRDVYHPTSLPTFKLYISPQLHHLPIAFAKLITALDSSEAFCFKSGASKAGVLRPDKLLVYFPSKASLMKVAGKMQSLFTNGSVHGVPFTDQLDDRGLLSWGVDPPSVNVLEAVEGGSWRMMVTEQLALAISAARHYHATWQDALPFVATKLQAAGINMDCWAPTDHYP